MKNFLTGLFLLLTFAVHGEEVKQVPVVTIQTNLGPIEVELNPAKSPESVENFLTYAKEGFYEGTIFHRVIESFVVQGGGYTPDFKKKNTRDPIPNEAANGLKNVRGTVAMARTSEPHSASSQFFFNVKDNKFLDYKSQTPSGFGYCVFGKVVEGMEVVDKIAKLPTDSEGPFRRDVPQTPVVIEAVRIGYAPPTKWVMAAPEKSPPPGKKKDKAEMPSMIEMQQDMLSDIDSMGDEESEGTKKGTKGGAATAKTDSAAEDNTAKADKADKAKADATESETSDQSEESQDKAEATSKTPPQVSATKDKKGKSPEDQAPAKTEAATETDTDQTASETAPVNDKVGKPSHPQSSPASPKEEPKSAEHSAKSTESEPSVATKKVAKDSKDSSKPKESEESDNVTSDESQSEDEAIAPGSSAADSEETKAEEETKADKSPPASVTSSTKAKPKEPKPVEEGNAKGEGEGEDEEEGNGNGEPANLAEKSNVTRSAMAVSNEMKRLAEEEDKSMEKTNQVTPKPAVKTPPPGAKPPDSPTSPDKPEPPAS